ncbi:MAG: hypothetical protein HRT88_08285 [Lentisphaeraceae bacterium]|nr:hypothetical protein [Lentisphaeraceae bacterium]
MKHILIITLSLWTTTLSAVDKNITQRLDNLEKIVMQLQQQMAEKDRVIAQLLKQKSTTQSIASAPFNIINSPTLNKSHSEHEGHDHSSHHTAHKQCDSQTKHTHSISKKTDTLLPGLNTSLVLAGNAGISNVRDSELAERQPGGHDPNKRGFNFQEAEINLSGRVDDMFNATLITVFTEDEVEIEEAYIDSFNLPYNLEFKAGFFNTNFGLINQQHPHAWTFIDQNLINNRLFGAEGLRGTGINLTYQLPLCWESTLSLGLQNSNGDHMLSFRGSDHAHGEEEHEEEEDERFEEGIAHRPYVDKDTRSLSDLLWSMRWANTFELDNGLKLDAGLSGLYGNNHTGGQTYIYGADLRLSSTNMQYGRPSWIWQSEIMQRNYKADAISVEESAPAAGDGFSHSSDTIKDWGLYTHFTKTLSENWSAGLRYEYLSGNGDSFEGEEVVAREEDFNRADRMRISPLLIYQASESTRLRLQYNMDRSDDFKDSDTLWLGLEVKFGDVHNHDH